MKRLTLSAAVLVLMAGVCSAQTVAVAAANAAGDKAGYTVDAGQPVRAAFVSRSGPVTVLATPAGYQLAYGCAVSDSGGWVGGYSAGNGMHATRWNVGGGGPEVLVIPGAYFSYVVGVGDTGAATVAYLDGSGFGFMPWPN